MKRQRSTTQMKEQTRNTEVQINEEEIGKLPEKEFRIMIVKIVKNLEKKMEKQWKQWLTLILRAPKSLQMVTAAMKLKDAYSLEEKL